MIKLSCDKCKKEMDPEGEYYQALVFYCINGKKRESTAGATHYCKPCKKEIPELEELYKEYSEKGILFYLINVGK